MSVNTAPADPDGGGSAVRRPTSARLAKAHRLLAEGRLQVHAVAERLVDAVVVGDQNTYRLGYRDGTWWCSCPAHGRCSHLLALRTVVPAPVRHAPSPVTSTADPSALAHVHRAPGRAGPGCRSVCGYVFQTDTEPADTARSLFCPDCLRVKVADDGADPCPCGTRHA